MPLERKHALISAVVAFVSWAYITEWIPPLRLVPHAFIAGFVANLLAAIYVLASTTRPRTAWSNAHRDAPLALTFAQPGVWEEEKATLRDRGEYRRPIIFPEAEKFSKQVDGLLDVILRDFVTSWYGHISKRPLFQNEIDRCIRSVLLSVTARLTDLDLVELGVARVLPVLTSHMRDFYDAERAVRGKALEHNVTESEELSMAIAGKYRGGRLHSVASLSQSDTTASSQQHLRRLVEKILPCVLPMNMRSSSAVTVLIREIVACAVIGPIVTMLADPDFWNQQIVSVGGAMLQDRKSVRKMRAALDQHAPASPGKPGRGSQFPRLRPYDSERQFERFVRAIRHVSTLNDARLFRSQVSLQLRRDAQVEGQDVAYIRRLETGRRLLDQKIASLSVADDSKPATKVTTARNEESLSRKRQASLRELIYDAAGLSYFMEYMDRQNLMRLVQFYLVVDGFRNPLEGDNDEPPASLAADPDRMDIAQMYAEYLSKPEMRVPQDTLQIVKQCLKAGSKVVARDYLAARREVLRMQTRVYNTMKDQHYEAFKKTDLYYKWLAVDDKPTFGPLLHGEGETANGSRGAESPAVHVRRPQLGALQKEPELRRAVLSTSDLKAVGRSSSMFSDTTRRSLDEANDGGRNALFGEDRSPLFAEDAEGENMVQSISSLKSYDSDGDGTKHAQEEAKAVREMQAALDNIVSDDRDKASLFSETSGRRSLEGEERRESLDFMSRSGASATASQILDRSKPSLSSLGLVGGPSNRGVFVDDLFGHEQERFAEDEREDSNAATDEEDERVEEAAAGDLGLAEAIDVLNADIERLSAQRNVLDSLTAKAELTNNQAELRILRKSEQSLQREIRRKEMQKQQYIVQESDNSLYGRALIAIKSVMVGREEDGHEYALYVIEIRRQAGEQMPAATWVITRRYSQFHDLHKRLKARFPAVRELDFPRRQTLFTLQKDFLQKRRVTLEKYLRALLLVPAICRSRELRAFLSQSAIVNNGTDGTQADAKDFVTRIYNSVSDGMEEFLGNIPVLDQLSVAGQNLISAATSQMSGSSPVDSMDPAVQNPATATEVEAELNAYETKEVEPFVKPICDLFLETFELSKGNSWLRGRTVVVVLHQLLGGTIERKVKEATNSALEDDKLASYVENLKKTVWPDGKMRPPTVPRTPAEKARTRKEAGLLLGALVPDIAGSVVGRVNAQAASRKIVAMLNNPRLNVHLIFSLIDEIIGIVFPETVDK
ncbi:hypothetical protein CKM354_000367700 [Cercospora kikuchii]|uniref:Sorting nexin-12 n=1 Tax=Cercospora kikuchii TaxID=84275 RepID=A0A9P3CKU8_9PEZI|nr:uncharacterized protein CKM354_000367700 [Cercospora kikuchii]GIZ40333.1 hypothetical protein CKM354_000367700 [Cercospora kikuchii]